MSNSHRKPIEDDFESYSFTEEFRPKKRDDTNRTRNKIEPNHPSKQNQNPSKIILKKFLNEEGAKICKRRQKSSSCKKKKREDSENDGKMNALQGELSEIKKAIQKMSLTQISQNPISIVAAKQLHSMNSLKKDYQRLLEQKDLQLQIQLESKARLEQAHIQSQLFAQQTKQFSQSIKKELSQVAIKHIDCERREQEILLLKEDIDQYRARQMSLLQRIRGLQERQRVLQNNLAKQSCLLQEEICRLSESLLRKDKELDVFVQKNNYLEQSLKQKDQYYLNRERTFLNQIHTLQTRQLYLQQQKGKQLKDKDSKIFILQQKLALLQSQTDNKRVSSQEDSISFRKMSDFCSTSRVESSSSCQSRLSLPESKVVIDGLSNMERKCQELYRQIRQERQKLNGLEEQEKNASKKVQILEKQSLALKENNAYLQQILVIKEKAIQQLHQKCSKLQLKLDEFRGIWQGQKNVLNDSLRECWHSKQKVQKNYSSKLQELQKQLYQQRQRNEQIISRSKFFQTQIQKLKHEEHIIQQLQRQICLYRQQQQKNSIQQEKLISETQASSRETNFWKEKYFCLEIETQQLKKHSIQFKNTLSSIKNDKIELEAQLKRTEEEKCQNQSLLKSHQSQLNSFSQQLSLLNGRLSMGQQIIQLLKSQVDGYQKKITHLQETMRDQYQKMREKQVQFALLLGNQLKMMKQRIEDIYLDKKDLQAQMSRLKEDNQVLNLRLNTLNIELDQLVPKSSLTEATEEIKQNHQVQIQSYKLQIQHLKDQNNRQLLQKQHQCTTLATKFSEEKERLDSLTLMLNKTVKENEQKTTEIEILQKAMNSIKAEIKSLSDQKAINQEAKSATMDQITNIQQKLQELNKVNSKFQQQNMSLNKTVCIQEEKITLLVGTIDALQQKQKACQEHIQQLQGEVIRLKNKEQTLIEQSKQQAKLVEASHLQAHSKLQHRIKDLQVQLHQYQKKYSEQEQRVMSLQARASELESILKESHSLLTHQRSQRQDLAMNNKKLLLSVQKYQLQLATREKQLDTSKKEQQLLVSKLNQADQKQKQLRKRWQSSQYQRCTAAKQLQSQAISLRVLREQNRNIEKVMSEQLNQRKAIIQQLVSEKKTLYSHLNN